MSPVLHNVLKAVLKHTESIVIALVGVFAPIRPAMAVALTLVIVDFISGILAAKKAGIPLTSAGFKRTVGKVVLYQVALCVTFLVEHYLTGELFPASKLVAALIGLVEAKSILENLDKINGSSMFNTILDRLVQSRDDLGKK